MLFLKKWIISWNKLNFFYKIVWICNKRILESLILFFWYFFKFLIVVFWDVDNERLFYYFIFSVFDLLIWNFGIVWDIYVGIEIFYIFV